MKNIFRNLIFVLCGLLIFADISYAIGVPITGTGFGEQTGLLHFDYTTNKRPNTDPEFDNPQYYIGDRNQFYISPTHDDFTGPGDETITANISTEAADCTVNGCLLKGFVWSDVIGWIALDGVLINDAVSSAIGLLPGEEDTPADPYPSSMFPRIKDTGALTGYAWNEYTGWIRLAEDDVFGTTTPAGSQDLSDWGAWLDLTAPMIVDDGGTPLDPTDDLLIGRPFHGYVWSEFIGWIKFGKEAGDIFAFDFGAFTTWFPDDTAPVVLSPNLVWFAVGVNTGYIPPNEPATVVWSNFVGDEESGINVTNSKISVERTADSDANCLEPVPESVILAPAYPNATLIIPTIGNLQNVPMGFCKYEVTAEIWNGANLISYLGDTYLPDPLPPPENMYPEIIVYVRAGDYDTAESDVIEPSPAATADGKDFVKYEVQLKDLAGNPLIDIDCGTTQNVPPGTNPQYQYDGCPDREVTLEAQIINELIYDLTNPPPASPYLTPVKHSDANVAVGGEYLLDTDTSIELNDLNLVYPLEIASYAPIRTYTPASEYQNYDEKIFQITSFDYLIENDTLPATNLDPLTLNPDPATETPAYNQPDPGPGQILPGVGPGTFTSSNINFEAPISTSNPELTSGGIENVLSLGVPADLTFNVNNTSSKSISVGDGGLSLDNIFQYWSESGNPSVAFMETHRILLMPVDSDGNFAWSDPFNVITRYEMYDGEYDGGPAQDATNSVFRYEYPFMFDFGIPYDVENDNPDFYSTYSQAPYLIPPTDPGIRNDGTYVVTGRESIPQEFPYIGLPPPDEDLGDPYNYEPGEIDRSDPVDLGLQGTFDPLTPFTISKEIQFTPQKFIPVTINDIQLRLVQEIGYRFDGQPLFSVYAQGPLIPGLDVRDIGLEALGTVAGEQIVTGRKFETVGTAGARKLQEQIRRNVAELTAGIAPCSVKTLTEFETTGPCVTVDPASGRMFAYYEGTNDEYLVIENDLAVPNNPYTIILKGGANLFIKGNIYYDPAASDNASLGFIVIAEEVGEGANVYLSPAPTNIVGILYAEGSLLSRDNAGQLYYGGAGGNIQDLANQLYWQGSIASRNTIAGAGQEKVPEGIECLPGDTRLNCAQRYDLDYMRRFTAVIDEITGDSQIASDGLFSGGGCCGSGCPFPILDGTCQYGPAWLPTTVTLIGNRIDEAQSELATFFIEQDPHALTNPPPGFTVTVGVRAIEEIR